MTSINAMRLNFHSGLMLCDEARYWNPEWMIFYTPEKIRTVLRPDIVEEQGIFLFMGQTGTSSIGDEFIDRTEKAIAARYDAEKKSLGRTPDAFVGLRELAETAFDVITDLKRLHVDDFLRGRFGFTTEAFVRGACKGEDGATRAIDDQDTLKEVLKYVTFEGMPEEVKGIFGNSQVLAGYDPQGGTRIFYMTERMPVCEEVQEIFLAQGSGRDTCDLQFSHFADTRTVRERRGDVDRVEGLVALLKGLDCAFRLTAGVEGYPKIIYWNADAEPGSQILEISDMRSKLAAEIVAAGREGFLHDDDVHELAGALVFEGRPFEAVNDDLFRRSRRGAETILKFLRGWPASAWKSR